MKAAFVGCGKIAFWHVQAINALQDVNICAVCDRDIYAAERIAGFTESAKAYDDYGKMLAEEKPDVVHILTPPDSHERLAIKAMEAGCHVFVEKPMTVTLKEADRMIAAAKKHGVQIGTNHNYLYGPSIAKARELIKHGEIGQVVHVNGFYGINTSDDNSYINTIGRSHWAWNLPGGAFINFLPHMIYLLLDFLPDFETVSDVIISREDKIGAPISELTVLLKGKSASGVVTFSLRGKPYQKYVEIFGTDGIIKADIANEIYVLEKNQKMPRQATKIVYSLNKANQLFSRTIGNIFKVFSGKLKSMQGLRNIIKDYYDHLKEAKEVPVTGEDGRLMVMVMEDIFKRTKKEFDDANNYRPELDNSPQTSVEQQIVAGGGIKQKVLVTGAAGFLGSYLVAALSRCGADVVAMVRNRAMASPLLAEYAEVVVGDIRNSESLEAAMKDVDMVYHCAAVTANRVPWNTHYDVNVQGTKNVFDSALKMKVKQIVHVSSVVIYGLVQRKGGGCFLEEDTYKQKPDHWAFYMRSKIDGEKIAREYLNHEDLRVSIARPGILYGQEKGLPVKGLFQFGSTRITIGNGRNRMPFTYIDNAVDCLLMILITDEASGRSFNIVDDTNVTSHMFFSLQKKISGEMVNNLPIPPLVFNLPAYLFQIKSNIAHANTPPRLTHFVIHSAYRNVCYDTSNSRKILGWKPEVSVEDSIRRTINYSNGN